MRLKIFIPIVLGACLSALIVTLYLVFSVLLDGRYEALESKFAEKNLDRIEIALDSAQLALSEKLDGWSTWDETYSYLGTRDQNFKERNLTFESLSTLKIDHLVFFNAASEVYDHYQIFKNDIAPVDPSELDLLRNSPFSILKSPSEPYFKGVLALGDKVFIAASRPILNNEGTLPPRGMLLASKEIDQSFIQSMGEQTKLVLALHLVPRRSSWSQNANTIFEKLRTESISRTIVPQGDETLTAYGLVRDVYGEPAALIEITSKRAILYEGLKTRNMVLMFTVIGVLATLFVLIFILNKKLVRRVTDLKDQIWRIARSQKAEQRVRLNGRDELSELAADINLMLTSLEDTQHALMAAKQYAEDASEAKSQFLASVSHELRTPIHGILGLLRMLFRGGVDRSVQSLLQMTYTTTQGLLETIDNLLDLSKIEAGKLTMSKAKFSPRDVIREVLQVIGPRAYENPELEVVCSVAPEVPNVVDGDLYRLRQILMNLLGNAIKFTTKGSVTLTVGCRDEEGNRVVLLLSCRDTGIGISESEITKIFDPYEQADSTLAGRPVGTGLGLAIVQQTTDLLGGKLDVKSAKGVGTEFLVEIPYDSAERVVPTEYSSYQVTCIGSSPRYTAVLRTTLEGYPVALSGVGTDLFKQTFEIIDSSHAVLLDVNTFNADAARVMIQHAVQRHIPVIATVNPFQLYNEDELRAHGVSHIAVKPLLPDDLFLLLQGKQDERIQRNAESPITGNVKVSGMAPLKILVADDNKTNRLILVNLLQEAGHLIEVAEDGIEVLELVEASPEFDLILTDIQMPRLDGIGATQKIREWEESGLLQGRLPIIALTAHAFPEERAKMIAAGVDDVITKPVEPAKLRNTLEKLFGDRISYSHHIPATPPIPPPTVVERGAKAKISIYALDHEGMRNRVGNNLKLFYNILRCFKDDAAETCSRVTIAWRGRNREELLQATHALKGVILCSGCTPAVNLIEQLERDEFFGAKGEQLLEELEVAVHELVQEAERKLDEASES